MSDWEIRQGHVLDLLRAMPDGSVQSCVTSPPYYGLRAYGTDPQIWGGDPECSHHWFGVLRAAQSGGTGVASKKQVSNGGSQEARAAMLQDFCTICSAWRGELGSEPSVDVFLEHLVGVLREVQRVLRPDGTLWLNMGDSYSGSGKGPTTGASTLARGYGVGPSASERQGFNGDDREPDRSLGPKNLLMVPWRLVLALQADGWVVRSVICWSKRSPMPESVRDRPTGAWEPIFLLSKGPSYYYDAEAVKEPASENTHPRGLGINPKAKVPSGWDTGPGDHHGRVGRYPRHKQNESFSGAVNEVVEFRNQRNVWTLGAEPFPEAHFATFPTEIPRRCILAGSRPGDLVLDPFSGSGTTCLVANRLGRRGLGLELNPEYVEMARRRIQNDAPLVHAINDAAPMPEQMALEVAG